MKKKPNILHVNKKNQPFQQNLAIQHLWAMIYDMPWHGPVRFLDVWSTKLLGKNSILTSLTRNSVQHRLLFTAQHSCGSKLVLFET